MQKPFFNVILNLFQSRDKVETCEAHPLRVKHQILRKSQFNCHPELVSGSIENQNRQKSWMLKRVQHDIYLLPVASCHPQFIFLPSPDI
jgi:hypothetical protein